MRRCMIVGFAFVLSGWVAPSALAVYKPVLLIRTSSTTLGARTNLVVGFSASNRGSEQPVTDDPTARVEIAIPKGYSLDLPSQPFGSRVGSVNAKYEVREPAVKTEILHGSLTIESPARYRNNDCASGDHDAVVAARFTVAGKQLTVPLFLDRGGTSYGVEAAGRIVLCFDPPENGALMRGRFFGLALTIERVVVNPAQVGTYVWRGFFTPYDREWQRPVQPATVEAQRLLDVPIGISLHVRRVGQGVVATGQVTAGGRAAVGVDVELLAGLRRRKLLVAGSKTRTDRAGRFRIAVGRTSARFFRVEASNPNAPAVPCGDSTAPGGCVTAGRAYFMVLSSIVRAAPS